MAARLVVYPLIFTMMTSGHLYQGRLLWHIISISFFNLFMLIAESDTWNDNSDIIFVFKMQAEFLTFVTKKLLCQLFCVTCTYWFHIWCRVVDSLEVFGATKIQVRTQYFVGVSIHMSIYTLEPSSEYESNERCPKSSGAFQNVLFLLHSANWSILLSLLEVLQFNPYFTNQVLAFYCIKMCK